ncbi:DNA/RNA helicase MER3/SLH1, DEAD-box [Aspergillus oryzae 100-8]|uniref:DNA 3'-5' helicase n=1 Tax=Aspergillus oryzae (strain 3.042) TaxID=1160506 RepID=I8TS41_ASPO3|nr:DNA/RNA helicase MER3/SLH1, DEAD-box superfamily [Aspergillus oryzae 3.042]KDE80218.1 DNA/RNA helicase MER3/SLH1, DEAD-box [Aspergillus oryzae 100-8]|eukprot:EIT76873.1 DNA/RNA helicase MER3/SLH1, DEAD-box superfamily [Aspergillus oryzae 3.042]
MRRKPYSSFPASRQGASYRRTAGTQLRTPIRSDVRTALDQRFSEGARNSSSLGGSRREELPISTPRAEALCRDDDLPFDAFDHQLRPEQFEKSHIAAILEQRTPFQDMPVSIRGIVLVSVHELPDKYGSLFHFPAFNAIQSKCFQSVYKGDDNIVLAAPTGSGKTVVMELAICRLLNNLKDERFKVIYQAPTKSLCSERFRDWNRKFHSLGLQCAELTGDTDYTQMRSVQNSQIIITTPEKWDSVTRKWKDHARLMQLVKLFLIDEVHILKESRGATLEAVVSRMKTIGSNVRFVALSATIPNSEDIATWLGKDATNQHVPAHREHFGEEFRPVRLQRFVYGYQSQGNDFAFDKMCSSKLPDILAMHSCRKPIMIFCCTRNSSVATAKELARLWSMSNPPARLWKGPSKSFEFNNIDLKSVAFHHAGLNPGDRQTIENGFLQGQINIICCTSTLAVGVNLPCHLVIIKNTVGWLDGGCKEYSDLEIMQMLGRAGRPQFDKDAVAVILTRKERVDYYERLVSGSESLESCLHLNLIDHLNAEIGLGNVTSVESAIRWLAGTFLFVRLRRNPTHYQLREGAKREDEDEMLRQICEKDIRLLQESNLVTTESLRSTQFGDAMARYYVRFETMKTFLTLKRHATMSQILSVISQAEEFRDVRLKAGEKSLYKEINRETGIMFPVKVDIALPAHKTSLLIQSELGAVEFPNDEQFQKHKFAFQQDKGFVFSHVNRLIRCIIDCQISLQDSVATRNALELARSFGAKVWDRSPFQMKQIEQVGVVAVRKLAAAGITSLEALECAEPHQIDMILSKNPPFGLKLLGRLSEFPKLRVSVKMIRKEAKHGNPVRIHFKAEVAFMNEKCPTTFQRRPVHVCFLAETSNGLMIDFRRMSASKVQSSQEIPLHIEMNSPDQYITCYAMCDDIAGTLRSAELRPALPSSLFSFCSNKESDETNQKHMMNMSRRRSNTSLRAIPNKEYNPDSFDSDDSLFNDFLQDDKATNWATMEYIACPTSKNKPQEKTSKKSKKSKEAKDVNKAEEPTQLRNGRWSCNHKCKDKTMCKHLCCREGLEKPPKMNRKHSNGGADRSNRLNQLTLSASITKHNTQIGNPGKRRTRKDSMTDITSIICLSVRAYVLSEAFVSHASTLYLICTEIFRLFEAAMSCVTGNPVAYQHVCVLYTVLYCVIRVVLFPDIIGS